VLTPTWWPWGRSSGAFWTPARGAFRHGPGGGGCVWQARERAHGTLAHANDAKEAQQVNSRTRVSTSGMWMNVPCSAEVDTKSPVLARIETLPAGKPLPAHRPCAGHHAKRGVGDNRSRDPAQEGPVFDPNALSHGGVWHPFTKRCFPIRARTRPQNSQTWLQERHSGMAVPKGWRALVVSDLMP